MELLNKYDVTKHNNSRYLKIETHNSMSQIIDILNVLRNADLELENFEKKKASLEDVFLRVISGAAERSELDASIS